MGPGPVILRDVVWHWKLPRPKEPVQQPLNANGLFRLLILPYSSRFIGRPGGKDARGSASTHPGGADWITNIEGICSGYEGHLQQARTMTRRQGTWRHRPSDRKGCYV